MKRVYVAEHGDTNADNQEHRMIIVLHSDREGSFLPTCADHSILTHVRWWQQAAMFDDEEGEEKWALRREIYPLALELLLCHCLIDF